MKQPFPRLAIAWSFGSMIRAAGLTALVAAVAQPAYSAQLVRWRFDPQTQQLELVTPGGTQPNYFILAQPPRIVIDLPETTVGPVLAEQRYSGAVRQIRVSQFQPSLTRVVIELQPDAEFSSQQVQVRSLDAQNGSWVIRPLLAGDVPSQIAANDAERSLAGVAIAQDTASAEDDGNLGRDDLDRDDLDRDRPPEPKPDEQVGVAPDRADGPTDNSDSVPPLEPGALEIAVDLDVLEEAAPVSESEIPQGVSIEEGVTLIVRPADAEEPADSEAPVAPPQPVPVESDVAAVDSEVAIAPRTAADSADDPAVEPADSVESIEPREGAQPNQEVEPVEVSEPAEGVESVEAAQPSEDVEPVEVVEPAEGAAPVEIALRVITPEAVLLPAGTVLKLRYPRITALALSTGESQQEVLLTTQIVQDQQGNIILPAGAQVIGRFEAKDGEGRFVAQALVSLDGNRPLVGVSALPLDQQRLQVEPDQVIDLQVSDDLLKP
ncbi:MAG: AMIN domain-containing protein [Elainellaceae cyanobacterium]